MKLIIDIPEELKSTVYNCGLFLNPADKTALIDAINNGTPLPKGHGRLGDLSKIYVELNEAQVEGTEEYKGLGEAKQIVCNAPTIIEADKAESEE